MPAADLPACVFCGKPIEPGEATAGRAPMAAHATCADAALADDDHWEAINEASGEERGAATRTPRVGCLGVASGLLAVALALRVMRALATAD